MGPRVTLPAAIMCLSGIFSLKAVLHSQTSYTSGYAPHARTEAPGTLIYRSPTPELAGRLTNIMYHQGWLMVGYENPGSDARINDLRFRVMDVSNLENDPAPVAYWPSDFGLDYGTNDRGREHWFTGNWGYNTHGHGRTAHSLHWGTLHVDVFGGAVERGLHHEEQFSYGWGDAPIGGRLRRHLPWMGSQDWAYGDDGPVIHFGKAWRTDPDGPFSPANYRTHSLGATPEGNFGVRGFPALVGDRFFVISDQRRSGLAIYRAPDDLLENWDPEAPVPEMQLLGLNKNTFGGYWPEFYARDGRLYVVSNGTDNIQVMDVTDPTDPVLVRDWIPSLDGVELGLRNATYPKFQDNLFLADGLVVNMDLLIAGHPEPVELVLEEPDGVDLSQYSMPMGNLIVSGGYGANEGGMTIHVRQQAPDTTPPRVGFHVPEVNRTGYSRHMPISVIIHEELDSRTLHNGVNFMIREVVDNSPSGDPVDCIVNLGSDNLLMLTPTTPLKAETTYQVDFPRENGVMDISGNRIEPYSWRFSTGNSVAAGNDPAPSILGFDQNQSRFAPGTLVNLSAEVSDNDVFEYRFDPGDGSGYGAWQGLTAGSHPIQFEHNWPQAGRYTARLQVRDSANAYAVSALNLIVANLPPAPLPTESSAIIVASDGAVWAVNPDADTVTKMDGTTGAKLGEYPVGNDPRNIAEDANGQLWVSCMDSDEIYLLAADGTVNEVLVLAYGDAPYGVVASPDGQTIYVSAHGSGGLYQFYIDAPTAPNFVELGPTPRAIAVASDHSKVFVTRFISAEYYGEVWRVDPTNRNVRSIPIHMVTDPDGNNSSAGVPNYLAGIAISPYGQYAVITGKKDNTFRGPAFGSADATHENTVRAMMATIDIDAESLVSDAYYDFDNADSPTGVRFSPYGDILLVALQGNNEIFAIDALDLGVARTTTRVPLQQATTAADGSGGRAPQGLAISPVTKRVFSQNFMSRTTTVFDASQLLDRGAYQLSRVAEIEKVAVDGLSPEVRLGKEIFYNANDPRMGAESYMSCASCHNDGGHDGRVWDFTATGEGLRRTTDLRGRGGMNHGNVHWSGNFDEIQDFEVVMRDRFLGEGFTSDQDYDPLAGPAATLAGLNPELDALAAYVASLDASSIPRSPHRDPVSGAMTEAALRGRDYFIEQNCMSCHDGSRLTASNGVGSLRDIGSVTALSGGRLGSALSGIDVPTLKGLHATGRYGHLGISEELSEFLMSAMGRYFEAEEADVIGGSRIDKREPEAGGGSSYHWDIFGAKNNAVVNVGLNGEAITFNNIDGGPGGTGQLWVRSAASRWARGSDYEVRAEVNGVETRITFPRQLSVDNTRLVGLVWRSAPVELLPGAANSITLSRGGGHDMPIDAIMVAHAGDLAKADPHRSIPPEQLGDIIAFLQQLDGSSDNLPADHPQRSWLVRHFEEIDPGPGTADWSADPDGDGINNRLEFILGLNPHGPDPGSARPRLHMDPETGRPAFHFRLREELGLNRVIIRTSTNLQSWHAVEPSQIEPLDRENGVWNMRVRQDGPDTGQRFFRLEVE